MSCITESVDAWCIAAAMGWALILTILLFRVTHVLQGLPQQFQIKWMHTVFYNCLIFYQTSSQSLKCFVTFFKHVCGWNLRAEEMWRTFLFLHFISCHLVFLHVYLSLFPPRTCLSRPKGFWLQEKLVHLFVCLTSLSFTGPGTLTNTKGRQLGGGSMDIWERVRGDGERERESQDY